MSVPVNFVFANIPSGYCFTTPAQYWTDIQALITGTVDGGVGFNYGSTTPSSENRGLPWIRTDAEATSNYIRTYTYSAAHGMWVSPHCIPPSDKRAILFTGAKAEIFTLDGGSGDDPTITAPTVITGSFWQILTAFEFKIPLGVGTGTTYDGATRSVAIGDTIGSEKVVLTEAQLPEHKHFIAANVDLADWSSAISASNYAAKSMTKEGSDEDYSLASTATAATVGKTSLTGEGDAHENMPPCVAVYFIGRTIRQYYTVAG